MTTVIGKPVYGNSGNSRPNAENANWKIDTEGSHPYRILPPFGALAAAGRWSQYEALHWGFALSNGRQRAYRCIRRKDRKTGMVQVECPMCLEIEKHKAELEARKEALKSEKKNTQEITQLTKPLEDWISKFNLQKGHFVNVIRPDGQIGRLFLKIKCKQALDILLPKIINAEGVDPIDSEGGVWIDFVRTGTGRHDTVYTVGVVEDYVEINGKRLKSVKLAPLSKEVLDRMGKEAFDLATYYKDLTYNEIQMLVSSGGDPSIVDSIFGAPTITASTQTDDDSDDVEAPAETEAPEAEASSTDSEEAALMAQLEAYRSKKTTSKDSEDKYLEAFKSGKL